MAHLSRPGDASHFEIAFFCALEAERHAIELALDEQYETEGIIYPRDPHDPNAYTTGRIGTHHVVIVYLTGVGNIESAAAAANLPMTFPGIKLAIAVGVCGVDPKARDYDEQEVLLGDVIVSTAVLRSSYGHQYGDGFALGRDVDTIRLPPIAIRSFLNRLEGITAFRRLKQKIVTYTETILDRGLRPHGEYPGPEKQVLYDAAYQHKHSKPYECETCAHCQQPFHNPCYSALQTPCETLGCDEAFQIDRPKIRIARGFHADGTPLHGRDQVASAQRPSLLFGKFASADSVMASAYHRDQLVRERGVVAFERAGAGCWDYIPTIIVKGACDYADGHTNEVWRQYSAINAVACAKAIVEEWRSEALPENSGITDAIYSIPRAMEACFDSQKLQDVQPCLPNTRVALLEAIHQWVNDANCQPFFWLQGLAGTGKTTVAKTVAQTLHEQGSLAGSFFFSRQGGKCGSAERFFSTLAYQLAIRSYTADSPMRQYRTLLHDYIKSDPDVFSKTYRAQWKHLIMSPLSQLDQGSGSRQSTSLVFVIDAVDECEPVTDISPILELLSQTARLKSIHLRFFVTGRPERSVHHAFRSIRENLELKILHQVESGAVNADIRTYLEHEFGTIQKEYRSPGWCTHDQLDAVVARSAGLFIYAASLCRALKKSAYPRQLLTQFLGRESRSLPDLNHMYSLILEQSAPEWIEDDVDDIARHYYRLIIGSLAVLLDAVSINSLHSLLATAASSAHPSPSPADIEATLLRLGSVIDTPYTDGFPDRDAPVRLFHSSFRVFLLDKRQPSLQHLQLDSYALHENMLNCCLNVMDTCLQKNICQLPAPDADPSTLSQNSVQSYIPLHVQYACKHWISHAKRLSKNALKLACADDGLVSHFLAKKAIYWIEAMSILGLIPQAFTSLIALRSLIYAADMNLNVPLIQDLQHFLATHHEVLVRAPLQIYSLSWPASISASGGVF